MASLNKQVRYIIYYFAILSSILVNLEATKMSLQTQKPKHGNSLEIWNGYQNLTSTQIGGTRQHQKRQQGSLSTGQCPVLETESALLAASHTSLHERVLTEPSSGERSFSARIVGIFSCLDSDSASNDLTLDFRLAKPVIDLAVRNVNRRYPHMRFNVSYRTAPDICRHQQAAGHAADEYYVNGANYFVGPGCSESLASVGQLASYWNVPICSTGYVPEVITARFKPLTLVQLSLSVQSVGEMLLELFQLYKWRHLVILTDEKHPLHSIIRDGLLEFFHTLYMLSGSPAAPVEPAPASSSASDDSDASSEPHAATSGQHQEASSASTNKTPVPYYINITARNFAHSRQRPADLEQIMLEAAGYSRVMLILAKSSTIWSLLEAAYKQGMSRGQFVFIAHELFETQQFERTEASASPSKLKQKYALDDKIDTQARVNTTHQDQSMTREMFQSLMTISLRIPTTAEFDQFRGEVVALSEREFNYHLQASSLKSLYSLGVAAFIYDCVMLYADTVDYILKSTKLDKIDGQTVFALSAGKTFSNALTGDLKINNAGQRVIDFTLNAFSPQTLLLEPIAHFSAIDRNLTFLAGRAPHWAQRNQLAPRSDPRCRPNDAYCRPGDADEADAYRALADSERFVLGVWLAGVAVASVAASSLTIGWLVYRRFRIESELLNLWWSIKYEDIKFEDEPDVQCDGKRSVSSLALSQESFTERRPDQAEPAAAAGGAPTQLSAEPAPLSSTTLATPASSPPAAGTHNKLAAAAAKLQGRGQARVHAPNQEPSISSQNKNVRLRLGAVLGAAGPGRQAITRVGLYKASKVAAKHLNIKTINVNRQLLVELRQVRDLTHENLIKFIGLCPDEPNVALVSELCTRGNLQDLLQNHSIRLDWAFRYSIINDIVDGLAHLHASPIQMHGRLKSTNCVIDNRFVVKLTDFGLPTLLAAVDQETGADQVNPRLLLWTAPEHLRTKRPLLSGSQKGDVYSLAIVFQEIITRCGPFECEPLLCGPPELAAAPIDWHGQQQQQPQGARLLAPRPTSASAGAGRRPNAQAGAPSRFPSSVSLAPVAPAGPMGLVQHKQRLEPAEIVNLVRMGLSPPFRPYFRPDVAATGGTSAGELGVSELIAIVQGCWREAPNLRPSIASVKQQIKKMRRGCQLEGANIMDNLLQRMERYTDNLESLVELKTAELMEEKKRSEELLYEMLPRFVVDQLKYGHSVTPEAYEAVTISFSDIKDFTSIAAQSSPIEVVSLLNQLYTEFDDCIAQYDVYKVETIGDAYMVVSGLPIRNGDLHAKEIAEMSLALLELISNFEIVHLPHVKLELRIGVHSGPCASGVVGTRMFRYCLFGDTVNTASRMESHGEPMRIHISQDSASILERFGCFLIEPRGQIDIKGKGLMTTFWLTGKSL